MLGRCGAVLRSYWQKNIIKINCTEFFIKKFPFPHHSLSSIHFSFSPRPNPLLPLLRKEQASQGHLSAEQVTIRPGTHHQSRQEWASQLKEKSPIRRQKSQRQHQTTKLVISQGHQLLRHKIYAEDLCYTPIGFLISENPMNPAQLILWVLLFWSHCSSCPFCFLQTFLCLLWRTPQALPNVWLWDSASVPISCGVKSL